MQTERLDGITYTLDDGKYYVTAHDDGIVSAIIRLTLNGVPVVGIAEEAFSHCTTLTTVEFVNHPDEIDDDFRNFEIGDYAFMGCGGLTSIELPDFTGSVGRGAFHSCTSLVTAVLPYMPCYIAPYAFYQCTSLLELNPLWNVAEGVCSHCTSLKILPIRSVSEIDEDAFEHCESLSEILIPKTVKRIGALAFRGCKGLKKVTFESPNGWYFHNRYNDSEYKIDLSDPVKNALSLSRMDFDDGVTAWYKK